MRPLVSLRIPSGWAVITNNFVEFAPSEVASDSDRESYLDENLLSIEGIIFDGVCWRTDRSACLIDLGWYPTGDLRGSYRLALVKGSWDDVPLRFEHRDCGVMKEAIELIMRMLAAGKSAEQISELLQDLTQTMGTIGGEPE